MRRPVPLLGLVVGLLLASAPASAQDLVWTGAPAPKSPTLVTSATVGQLADGVALPLVVNHRFDATSITTLTAGVGTKALDRMTFAPVTSTSSFLPPGFEVTGPKLTSYTLAATFASNGTMSSLSEQLGFAFEELVVSDDILPSPTPSSTFTRPNTLVLEGDAVADLDVVARSNVFGMSLTLLRDPVTGAWRAEPLVLTRRAIRERSESAFFADLAATGGSLDGLTVAALAADGTTRVVAWRFKNVRVVSYRLLTGGSSSTEQVGLAFSSVEVVPFTSGREGTPVVIEVAK